ncbi:MAG: SDR family NAD(P)-dependent oxidoreductase [Solirubrobacterales bacterium]|nr:SDR family NAD(P)-dependent oxidoreductase [Solirubrobacterales bacterium]
MATGNPFRNRVALVTGASGGIGQALARRLTAEGASVALAYGANAKPAQRLADELVTKGGHALAVGADLRRADAAAELVAEVEPQLGSVDILLAAAGLGRQQTLEEISVEDFDEMLAINLRAPFLLAQQTLPGMQARGFGRIMFVSSVAAFTGGIVGPHYAASKAGLHGLTHFLAGRVAGDGVTVNAIAPALITDTGMLPGEPDELRSRVPVGRLGQPDEVADLAIAMLRNPYLTNQVVSLDGGMHPR